MRAILTAGLMACASPVWACDVALMLAVDVSGSVAPEEYRIQMDGLADALEDRTIAGALVGSRAQVALMQWTGTGRQRVVTTWTQMESREDVARFAAQVRTEPRIWRNFSTAIGEALSLSIDYFALVPECRRRIIDISGDGVWNHGPRPSLAWATEISEDVTINGLVILGATPNPLPHYEAEVIGGYGAFVEVAEDFNDYPRAILRKLLRELSPSLSAAPADTVAR